MERVLVAGATGLLGGRIVRQLLARGRPVRAFVRDPARARALAAAGAELAPGDLTVAESFGPALAGVTHVISTANAFMQKGANTPARVDVAGTRALAEAARDANVTRFLYVSALAVEPDSIVDFFRYKYHAQEAVRASGVRYTIVRPPGFMEVWAEVILGKARNGGPASIFGPGDRPFNYISVDDVARVVIEALDDPAAENQLVDILGPEDLTQLQVVATFERHVGHPVKRKHVPIAAMRVMRHIVRPFNPVLSRMISGGLFLATNTQDRAGGRRPDFELKTFAEVLAEPPAFSVSPAS